jgi:hypothetical protein
MSGLLRDIQTIEFPRRSNQSVGTRQPQIPSRSRRITRACPGLIQVLAIIMQPDPADFDHWRLASLTIKHQSYGSPKSIKIGSGSIGSLRRWRCAYRINIKCRGGGQPDSLLLKEFPKIADLSVSATEIQWNLIQVL